MNILVLGNGFDLAHGLKTKYKDFLNAVEITNKLVSEDKPKRVETWDIYDKAQIPPLLCEKLNQVVETKKFITEELRTFQMHWDKNFWFRYFKKQSEDSTWIDFEKRIKEVCEYIETAIYSNGKTRKLDEKVDISKVFEPYAEYLYIKEKIECFSKLLEVLEEDFKNLINSLDIYIYQFINYQDCEHISPDIVSLDIDKVINFNYSTTYQKIYNIAPNIKCDYIHGKAGLQRNKEYSNLVLGYDERKKEIYYDAQLLTLVPFKKYYQRVLKATSNEYIKWLEEIQADQKKEHYIYFFGHSMDITDEDIIKALILNTNVKTTIYFYENQDKINKLKNLILVLGYQNFIEYTKNENIQFVKQDRFENKNHFQIYVNKMAVKNLYILPFLNDPTYESVIHWLTEIKENSQYYEIVYIYLAIDGLHKHNFNITLIKELEEVCRKHCGDPCSLNDFLKFYTIYCGSEKKFDNFRLQTLIEEIYKKRENNVHKKYDIFKKVDKKLFNYLSAAGIQLNQNEKLLSSGLKSFLRSFDNDTSYPEIYEEMVDFLGSFKLDLVEKKFNSLINNSELSIAKIDKVKNLRDKYKAKCWLKVATYNA